MILLVFGFFSHLLLFGFFFLFCFTYFIRISREINQDLALCKHCKSFNYYMWTVQKKKKKKEKLRHSISWIIIPEYFVEKKLLMERTCHIISFFNVLNPYFFKHNMQYLISWIIKLEMWDFHYHLRSLKRYCFTDTNSEYVCGKLSSSVFWQSLKFSPIIFILFLLFIFIFRDWCKIILQMVCFEHFWRVKS